MYCTNTLHGVSVDTGQKQAKNVLPAKAHIINLDSPADYFITQHSLLSKEEVKHSTLHVDASLVWVQVSRVKPVYTSRDMINDEVWKLGTFIDNTIALLEPISGAPSVTVSRCSVL